MKNNKDLYQGSAMIIGYYCARLLDSRKFEYYYIIIDIC